MCGRYALINDARMLARRFGAEPLAELSPRYNVAPSQTVLIVRAGERHRQFAGVRWGLLPAWAKDRSFGGYSTINARAETVAIKPAFRTAFRQRRCLVPCDLYFEWQALPGVKAKQPYAIALANRETMALAGLWETWRSPGGEVVESCTIIVTEGNDLMRPIHDRMPVILPESDWDVWLAPDLRDATRLQTFLKPYPAEAMVAWPVSTRVNNPKNDEPECIEPVTFAADL